MLDDTSLRTLSGGLGESVRTRDTTTPRALSAKALSPFVKGDFYGRANVTSDELVEIVTICLPSTLNEIGELRICVPV
jgi:hypothetical protein